MDHKTTDVRPSGSWENEGGSLSPNDEVARLGIIRVPTETYRVGGYTYTNLQDAIAQGRRIEKLGKGTA